jgi:CRISPR-associated exonuclease Cas4
MESSEPDDPVMISALEHYSYCPRQCALIHVEQVFDENLYTLRGRAVHQRVDEVSSNVQDDVRVERSVPLVSTRLGLIGKADVVEFYGETPYPVEYKHGPRRTRQHDDLQLCAQAICLEEMTGVAVPRGAIYHHSSRRRREVIFDESLRREVEEAIAAVRQMLLTKTIPPPVNDARCRHCSLLESCLPSVLGEQHRAERVLQGLFNPVEL